MTAALDRAAPGTALAPITATLLGIFGVRPPAGLAADLIVTDPVGWVPATTLVDGTRLPDLLDAASRRWNAAPHVGAALVWKAYTYWLTLPAVLGWAAAHRVPLLRAEDVLVHFEDHNPVIEVGLRPSIEVAVLASDPVAADASAPPPTGPRVRAAADETELLGLLRSSLLDEHLTPLIAQIRARVRLGSRTLLGSLASGMAYGVLRAAAHVPVSTVDMVGTLTGALGIDDLIEMVPGPAGGLMVQRRTCCLAFTLPKPRICAGCCIR